MTCGFENLACLLAQITYYGFDIVKYKTLELSICASLHYVSQTTLVTIAHVSLISIFAV